MSSRRTSSNLSENEINEVVSRLQAVLPRLNRRTNSRASVSKVVKEACCHVKKLQKEVDELSDRLSRLMDSTDISDIDEQSLRNILQQ
ncbi:transcription factor ILI5-like [Prosopis cineraria]|uniref:transcription factor ILI5-like n=1 Tax=Prosopis cineraria TaxID=364024 RepID=UPI0024107C32|nr:transcription factor ILI5-like [Prosopis cineraria]